MQKPICKPGDLAIIYKTETPENLGKIVTVLEEYKRGTMFNGAFWAPKKGRPKGLTWIVRGSSPLVSKMRNEHNGFAIVEKTDITYERVYNDDCLWPLPKDLSPEEIEEYLENTIGV